MSGLWGFRVYRFRNACWVGVVWGFLRGLGFRVLGSRLADAGLGTVLLGVLKGFLSVLLKGLDECEYGC